MWLGDLVWVNWASQGCGWYRWCFDREQVRIVHGEVGAMSAFLFADVAGLGFGALRLATNLLFMFEAQRVLGSVVRPTGNKIVDRVDARVMAAAGVKVREEFVMAGKHKIRTVFHGQPSAPPLVLIHGHSMSATYWYRNYEELAKMGYYVIALDLLGWGRSDRPAVKGTEVEDVLQFYLTSFELWRKKLSLDNFSIISHSIGAYVAFEFTRQNPDAVKRLMMITPAAIEKPLALYRAIYFSLTPQAVARRLGLLALLLFELKFPKEGPYTANSLKDLTWHLNARPGPSGDIAIKRLIQFESWNQAIVKRPMLENIEAFKMPVHLMSAELDTLIPSSSVDLLYDKFRKSGTQCTLDMALGSDHCPFLEVPEQFHQLVAKHFALKQ